MEVGIEKYCMLIMKSGNRHMMNGMELLNQKKKIRKRGGKKT